MADTRRAHKGDLIQIEGHRVGDTRRTAEILEILGTPEHEHYRVRWDDGHEAMFYPGNDAVIRHVEHPEDGEPVLIHEP